MDLETSAAPALPIDRELIVRPLSAPDILARSLAFHEQPRAHDPADIRR